MKKKTMKDSLKKIEKALSTSEASTLIKGLLIEVELYDEAKSKKESSTPTGKDDFELPVEILGKSEAYALFTDGACRGNPGPGSYGFVVQDPRGEVVLEGSKAYEHTTNNQMELSGVIEGVRALESKLTPFTELYIYTDSKYVVDGMKSWVAGWKKRGWKKADKKTPENVDRWKALDELSNLCHFNFIWVKGHAGHPQNEYVDQLANIVLDGKRLLVLFFLLFYLALRLRPRAVHLREIFFLCQGLSQCF